MARNYNYVKSKTTSKRFPPFRIVYNRENVLIIHNSNEMLFRFCRMDFKVREVSR